MGPAREPRECASDGLGGDWAGGKHNACSRLITHHRIATNADVFIDGAGFVEDNSNTVAGVFQPANDGIGYSRHDLHAASDFDSGSN
jgi:hypothetical protein